MKHIRLLALLMLTTLVWNEDAAAQQDAERDTGRHKPEPVVTETARDSSSESSGMSSRWFFGLELGAQGGTDLWHVETVSGLPPSAPWEAVTPFTSERFNATLDSGFAAGLFLGRRMGEMWSLKMQLVSARQDLAAEALQGQGGAVFLYDRLTITSWSLASEVRLVNLPSYPFLSLGVVLNHLTAGRETELNQDQIGLQMGIGYAHQLSADFVLKIEARYSRSPFDIGDFVPRTQANNQPVLILAPQDNLNLYGIHLGVQLSL